MQALARMQPIAELIDDPSLSFDFPDPEELRPPLITLDLASVERIGPDLVSEDFEIESGGLPGWDGPSNSSTRN